MAKIPDWPEVRITTDTWGYIAITRLGRKVIKASCTCGAKQAQNALTRKIQILNQQEGKSGN